MHRGEGRRDLQHVLLKGYSRLVHRAELLLFIILCSSYLWHVVSSHAEETGLGVTVWCIRRLIRKTKQRSLQTTAVLQNPLKAARSSFCCMHLYECVSGRSEVLLSCQDRALERQHHRYLVSGTASVCLPQTTLPLSDGYGRRAEGEEALRRNKRLA